MRCERGLLHARLSKIFDDLRILVRINEVAFVRADGEYRTRRRSHHALGHAANQEALDGATAVRADDDQSQTSMAKRKPSRFKLKCSSFRPKRVQQDGKQRATRHHPAAQKLPVNNAISIFHTRNRPDERNAFRLLISAHHPYTLRYPASGAITPSDRLRHALTWKYSRRLSRLRQGCGCVRRLRDARVFRMVITRRRKSAWCAAGSSPEPAPSGRLRRGKRHPVPVSVIVDTDDAVISLLTPTPDDLLDRVMSDTADDGLLDVAEATAWPRCRS
jgi:hypothetical protein